MQELEILVLTNKGLQFVVEFEDTSQSGWFIGAGQAMMTRVSLFKETKGVVLLRRWTMYLTFYFSMVWFIEV